MKLPKKKLVSILSRFIHGDDKSRAVSYIVESPHQVWSIQNLPYTKEIENAVFIDYFPGSNWAHKSLYVFLNPDGEVLSTIEAQFPPRTSMQILDKPSSVENWELLSNSYYEN